MKKLLFIILLFLGNEIAAQYNFGFIVGTNYSTNKNISGVKPKPAFSSFLGISNQYRLNKDLGFELNILYSGKGYKQLSYRVDVEYEKIISNYLDAQLLTKSGLYKKMNFIGGFGCGYLFGERVIPRNPVRDVYLDHFDIYFIGGFEYDFKEKLKLQLKYNHTITENYKNRVLQLGVLVLLKKKTNSSL